MALTPKSYWGYNVELDAEEQNGEALNDAVYTRNRKVEEALNCVIRDNNHGSENELGSVATLAQTEIMAGDAVHDIMYIPASKAVSWATQNYFYDLHALDNLKLDEDYWDQVYNSAAEIDGKLWWASNDACLWSYNSMWCIFFNEEMLEDSGMDMPYDLAREGKWTLDELYQYSAALANLNSDTTFDWSADGSAVYGLVTHPHASKHLVLAADNYFVTKQDDHSYLISIDTERFYNTCEKIAKMYGEAGTTFHGLSSDFSTDGGYVYTFLNERTAFLTAEIKTANNIRDMEATFGVVPLPKYDEKQEDYRTPIAHDLVAMVIPATVKDADTVALVVDALAYESSQLVVPTYFDATVSQKGLRNEDSIEMMEIMRRTRVTDIGYTFSWATSTADAVRDKLKVGDASVASVIASAKTSMEANIDKFRQTMGIE